VCGFQQQGVKQRLSFKTHSKQFIPLNFQDNKLQSLSVLEKYSVYFMQKPGAKWKRGTYLDAGTFAVGMGVEYPGSAAFRWVWDIFRQKLIRPTVARICLHYQHGE